MMASNIGEHQADTPAGERNGATEQVPTVSNVQESGADEGVFVCPRCGTEAEDHAYCSSCGFHLAAEKELPTWAAFKAAANDAPAKPAVAVAPPDQPSQRRERNPLKVFVPILALVAVSALAVAVISLIANRPKSTAPLAAQVHQVQVQLTAANRQLASDQVAISSLKSSSQAGEVSTLQTQMTSVQNKVQKFQLCVPQLQQEINGLNVQTSWQGAGGWLTSAYLQNPTIVSADCSKLLNTSSH
jgi:hypothetical protein